MGDKKGLRDAIVAALPIYIGIQLAAHGIPQIYAAAVATALLGFLARGYRLLRARFPESATVAWLFGVEQKAPDGVDLGLNPPPTP